MKSTLTSKGQATIPKAVRDHLGVGPGDQVKFFLHPDGTVLLLPRVSVTALRGIIPARARPVTDEDIEAGIKQGATERMRRLNRESSVKTGR